MQAKEKEAQKHQSLIQEMDDNYTEMNNHVNGDILTENPTVAQSALGQHRCIITSRFTIVIDFLN